jgi:phenylalanine ammonia-lyase
MMPLISFYGQSIVDRFPTHAEQFNQNINSQAMNSANLARESLDVLEHYLAAALLCGVQAVELRAKLIGGSYDARTILSPATARLYEAARAAAAGPPDAARPLHWNDLDEFLQPKVEGLLADIQARGAIFAAMGPTREALRAFGR